MGSKDFSNFKYEFTHVIQTEVVIHIFSFIFFFFFVLND
jgi:hypothetical protein